jgi:hypothetical protein
MKMVNDSLAQMLPSRAKDVACMAWLHGMHEVGYVF